MPRPPRNTPAGYVYHVMNRGFLRCEIFSDDHDYQCFLEIVRRVQPLYNLAVCAFCLMPNHWHMALWPREDNIVSKFLQHVESTHVQVWRARWGTTGHLYQGRFRCVPVAVETHYLRLIRYIERNAVRALLAECAWDWRWSSAWTRDHPEQAVISLEKGPIELDAHWRSFLKQPDDAAFREQIALSIARGRPLGDSDWVAETAEKLKLQSSLGSHGGNRRRKTVQGV